MAGTLSARCRLLHERAQWPRGAAGVSGYSFSSLLANSSVLSTAGGHWLYCLILFQSMGHIGSDERLDAETRSMLTLGCYAPR